MVAAQVPGQLTPDLLAYPGVAPGVEAVGNNILMGPGGTQSYDRFKAEYQIRTGDTTADPFLGLGDRNAARVYNQAAANAWTQHQQLLQGVVPAVAGPTALGPVPAATAVAAKRGGPVATLQPGTTYGDLDQQAANFSMYRLNHPDEDPSHHMEADPTYQSVLRSLGGGQIASDAEAYKTFTETGHLPKPTRYQSRAETNPESVLYGLDSQVLNNPEFQALKSVDPIRAGNVYEKLTNLPYSAVQDAQTARKKDRETLDDMMVSRLANDLVRNPETGEWGKYRQVRKTPGYGDKFKSKSSAPEYEDQFVPLNDIEKQWLKSGAFTRKTGISLDQLEAQRAAKASGPPPQIANNPKAVERYNNALKTSGDPKVAARLADLESRREGNVNFQNMMSGIAENYTPGIPFVPRTWITDPQQGMQAIGGMAQNVLDIGKGLLEGASAYPR